jgi:ABC-2 type transport system ATP-binding protein
VLVEEGDVVALLGPNGAGKTTTLMTLLGIVAPDAGSVSLLGRRLPKERSSVLAEVSFAASYVSLPHDLRVKHHLWVFADLYGVPRSRAIETLELFRVGDLFDRVTTHLSSGQRTLVGLAKATLNRPRLLVLDEPTASLDPEVGQEVRRVLLDEQARDGSTILMTSHNMSEIEQLCRRVIFLAGGRTVADGTFVSIAEQARG